MLTLSIILEHFGAGALSEELTPESKKRWFPDITLARYADDVSMRQGWLHIVSEEEAVQFREQNPNASMLCVISEPANRVDAFTWQDGFVMMRTNKSVDEVYLEVRALRCRIGNWQAQVDELYRNRGSYQDVLSISEDVVCNLVTISDSAYRLLAHTPDITTTDQTQAHLLEHGHHAPAVVRLFSELRLPNIWRAKASQINVIPEGMICEFPTLSYAFAYRENYYVHAVMLCERVPVTDGLIDRFELLIQALTPFVQRDWDAHKGFAQAHDHLFEMLLKENRPTEAVIAEEAALLKVPFTGAFRLGSVMVADVDELGVDGIAWRLVELLPDHFVSVYRDAILILFSDYGEAPDNPDPGVQFLDSLASSGICSHVGVSSTFSSLVDFDLAYRQAAFAQTLARTETGSERAERSIVVEFDGNLTQFIFEAFSKDVRMVQFCTREHPVAQILREDGERNTRVYEILKTYLENDCRATPTAELLGMHRNNVVYHIERIKDRFRLDLSDPETRFEILAVIRLLRPKAPNASARG